MDFKIFKTLEVRRSNLLSSELVPEQNPLFSFTPERFYRPARRIAGREPFALDGKNPAIMK